MYDKGILSEKVADTIKQMIMDKKFVPGDKLPNELHLTDALNVSRSTVREAIKILVSSNILEVRRGKGTFVAQELGLSKDPLGVSFMDQQDLLYNLYESRLIMEPEIAALAARRATAKDIAQLKAAFTAIVDDIKNGRDHTEHDIAFHNVIAKSSHNPIIHRILPIIHEGISHGCYETKHITESGDKAIIHHQNIMEAIINGDEEASKKWMAEHIQYGMEQIMK